jgi:hypothetical protein
MLEIIKEQLDQKDKQYEEIMRYQSIEENEDTLNDLYKNENEVKAQRQILRFILNEYKEKQEQLKQKEDFANVISVFDPKDVVKNFFDWYDKTVWSQHKKRDFEKIYGCYLKDRK